MQKSLDIKLAKILANPDCGEFILADAKDADMAFGMAAGGKSPEHHAQEGRFRSLAEYRDQVRANVVQGLVDIMLMSASTNEVLTIRERLFDASHITPAIRANDTTDIWLATGSEYRSKPARPFRSATIDHGMCGKATCEPGERNLGADLGLYSITFNNNLERDLEALERYKAFRLEAETKGFRHFLEVFEPNQPSPAFGGGGAPADLGRFINDNIARTLAGVTSKGRPVFLKIPYLGPAAIEQLAGYDRSVIVGILGGSAGTTMDAFHQLWEARKYGARVALYGRMINNAEDQRAFIQHLRWIADGQLSDPAEGVRSYHAALSKSGITPYRSLEDDLVRSSRASAYSGVSSKLKHANAGDTTAAGPSQSLDNATPDFTSMTRAEKLAWNRKRWDRILG